MKNFYTFLIAVFVSGFGFGQNSQVLAPIDAPQIGEGSISSLATTSGSAIPVLRFRVTDDDADALDTNITTMRFVPDGAISADWVNHIQGVTLTGVPNGNIIINTLTNTEMILNFTSPVVVGANDSVEFVLSVFLNEGPDVTDPNAIVQRIIDGSTLKFKIDGTNSGFIATGSDFSTSFAAPINGSEFTIAVVATKLTFLQQPTNVAEGLVMTPSVQVALTDTFGNVDLDINENNALFLTVFGGSDPFTGSNTTIDVSGGIGTFNNLILFNAAFNVLRVQSLVVTGIAPLFSDPFEVTPFTVGTTYQYNSVDGWVSGDPSGVSQGNDAIEIISGNATITDDTNIYTVLVNPGASLTVDTDKTLTVVNNMTLESSSTSYSSFIFNGIPPNPTDGSVVGGTINYKRFVNANSNGNDLISAPLKGLGAGINGIGWQDFLNMGTNSADLLSQGTSPIVYAFAPFLKGSTDAYVNFTSNTDNGTTRLNSGVGYRVATVADDPNTDLTGIGRTLTFSGDVRTNTIAVSVGFDPGPFADWNLVGNPYPSYMSVVDFFTSTVGNPIPNIDKITLLSGIYGYDATSAGGIWDVITLANVTTDVGATDRLIAPGQGFLIPAAAAGVAGSGGTFSNSIYFDNSMRRTGSSDDFIVGRNASVLTFLKLNASTTDKSYKTQFYFNENASLGGDHGYDGRVLGTPPNFALYSHLVQDNTGLPMALQALHPSDLVETTVIPLGVNANQGEQLTFSILESTLPDTIEVYLEDTVTNTFTLLNNGDYTLTPNVALNGTGRFYLRFGEGTLSTTETTLADLNIFTNQNDKTIVIAGQLLEPTTASVYDIQGRLVNTTSLVATSRSQTIDVSNLSSGVYVVQVNNGTQNKTQKVILR